MAKKQQFEKRIEALFTPLEINTYREDKKGKHWIKEKLVKAPWIEFTLVPKYDEHCYGITLDSLKALSKLLGTTKVEVNGWSDGIDGPTTLSIIAYFVKFGK